MVAIGSDVISLYPNLDVNQVGDRVKQAVLRGKIKWEGIDYMEGARYIALNWTETQCRQSNLRKILPWRRKKNGTTRPGVRGTGPMGPTRGDQDQWVFPRVTLTPEDKLEIIGTVLSIATLAMFQLYSFNGKTYRQREGGPIGLKEVLVQLHV